MLSELLSETHSTAQPRILHAFPNFSIGGSQKRFAQIANVPDNSFRHIVFATGGNYDARQLLRPGTNVEFARAESCKGGFLTRLSRYRERLASMGPDLVVTYNWGAIEWALASWTSNFPHIHIEDGFGPDEVERQLARRIWFRRLALRNSCAIVVPSRTLEMIARKVWKFPQHQIRYIPNGVDLNAHNQGAVHPLRKSDLSLAAGIPIVGWVGALRKEKNVSRLLRAVAATHIKCVLVLVGDGPERLHVEDEIRTLNIENRVCLLGTRADVERILPLFDVLALSSDTEQMPIAILEGMASGLPIAAIDVGDVRAVVAKENLPFIVDRSCASLTAALDALLATPTLRQEIGAANRRRVAQNFSADGMIGAYRTLFSQALAHGTRPTRRTIEDNKVVAP